MRKTLVYGVSVSGVGAIKLLLAQGKEVVVFDDVFTGELPTGVIDRRGLNFQDVLNNVCLVVLSPSIPLDSPLILYAKTIGIEVISEIELGFRNCKSNIIAITGTNGKTTTTMLMREILNKMAINCYALGNIGLSFCGKINDLQNDDVVALEVSSFQLEAVNLFAPKFAICLNISPDHLERHKTFQNYIDCKFNIFKKQTYNDYAILNFDDSEVKKFAIKINSKIYYISKNVEVKGAYCIGDSVFFKDNEIEYICNKNEINLPGAHNLENVLACIVVAKVLNINTEAIVSILKLFKAPKHRIQFVATKKNIKYFNDSKSTNISSTICAAKSMIGKTTLIVGGFDKGLSYEGFFNELPLKIGTIIAIGANSDKIIEASKGVNSVAIIKADDLFSAINIAKKVVCKNVLFSPSTSSFDKYKNYEERGEHFIKLVGEIDD